MTRYLALAVLPLALAACGSDDPAQALADCQAEVAEIQAEREQFMAENMSDPGAMSAGFDGEAVSLEELDRFTEMQVRLQELENRLAVTQQRCAELAG